MSDNIRPVSQACMADLGRLRQDDLPLSIRQNRVFTPHGGRKHGARVAGEVRGKLNDVWTVMIKDDESTQMAGLSNSQARPWAAGLVKRLRDNGQLFRAPRTHQPAPTATTGTNSGNVATRAAIDAPNVPAGTIPEINEAEAGTYQPTNVNPVDIDDYVLLSGHVKMVPARNEANAHVVEFVVRLLTKEDVAYLVLSSASKGQRTHALHDFDTAMMDGPYCMLRLLSPIPDNQPAYFLRLAEHDDTVKFANYLKTFQLHEENANKAKRDAAAKVAARSMLKGVNATSSAADPVPAPVPAPVVDEPAPKQDNRSGILIDMEDWDQAAGAGIPTAIVDKATNHLAELVNIIMEKLNANPAISGEIQAGIQDGLIRMLNEEPWFQQLDENARADFGLLARAMVSLKMNLQRQAARLAVNEDMWASATTQPASTRIQYSPEELQKYRANAVPKPQELEDTTFLPVPGASKEPATPGVLFPSEQIAQLAQQHRDWIMRKDAEAEVEPPIVAPPAPISPGSDTRSKFYGFDALAPYVQRMREATRGTRSPVSVQGSNPEPMGTSSGNPDEATGGEPEPGHNTPRHPERPAVDRDNDVVMGNMDAPAVPAVLRPGSQAVEERAFRGLAFSHWARAASDGTRPGHESRQGGEARREEFSGRIVPRESMLPPRGSSAMGHRTPFPPLPPRGSGTVSTETTPADAPARRRSSNPNIRGLSSSRYADKHVHFEFDGYFTGAR